jgi:hypothetical protein
MRTSLRNIINRSPTLSLVFIFLIAELIINPVGNFPLNDDWWYAHLYHKLFEESSQDQLAWGAASLWGQLALTKPFILLLGYSYTTLRCFTLVLSLLSIIFLFNLCTRCLKMKILNAFVLSILFLFNPLFLCLSNSYMSDVPFLFFLLGGLYFYLSYRENKKIVSFVLSLLFFSFGILTRQLMLAFLIGIAASEFITKRKLSIKPALVIVIPLLALFLFESWMRIKSSNVMYTYVFFRSQVILNRIPMAEVAITILKRWIHFVSHTGLVLSPILVPYLIHYFKKVKFRFLQKEFILTLILSIPVFISLDKFPLGNYIFNFGLGPDTLYDVFLPNQGRKLESPVLFMFMKTITYISSFAIMLVFVEFLFNMISDLKKGIQQHYFTFIFLISVLCYYVFLCFSSGIFDRYTMPVTLIILLAIHSRLTPLYAKNYIFYSLFFILVLYSTLGTKDYLNSMRARWEVVKILKEEYKAADEDINAGYEHEGSCFPKTDDWYPKWMNSVPNGYMVSRQNIKNYVKLGAYSYPCYMPFRTDTIFYLKLHTITTK